MVEKKSCNAFQLPKEITETEVFSTALTHRSASKKNNERLEYLGDAVLGLVVANILYKNFPESTEGDLSRFRSHLVRKETLARIANQYQVGSMLSLGSGERKSGGVRRSSILADALEAIIGAVYLTKGFDFTYQFIEDLYQHELTTLPPIDQLKDFKTRLQERLQSAQISLPTYEVVNEMGEANNKHFVVECCVRALDLAAKGEGGSKRKAEQEAAKKLLALVIDEPS